MLTDISSVTLKSELFLLNFQTLNSKKKKSMSIGWDNFEGNEILPLFFSAIYFGHILFFNFTICISQLGYFRNSMQGQFSKYEKEVFKQKHN